MNKIKPGLCYRYIGRYSKSLNYWGRVVRIEKNDIYIDFEPYDQGVPRRYDYKEFVEQYAVYLKQSMLDKA